MKGLFLKTVKQKHHQESSGSFFNFTCNSRLHHILQAILTRKLEELDANEKTETTKQKKAWFNQQGSPS